MKPLLFILFLLGITVVSGIIRLDDGGGGGWDYGSGGGGGHHHHSHSSSSSSEEHGHGGHGHHGPRPPRPARCPTDWITFNRPQGSWCVKVFHGAGTTYTRDTAQSMCQTQGAVLTGIQDADERIQMASAARILTNGIVGLNNVYIGAIRRAQCPHKASCAPLDTFEWTDGHTTGTDGFFFAPPEPNALWDRNWG